MKASSRPLPFVNQTLFKVFPTKRQVNPLPLPLHHQICHILGYYLQQDKLCAAIIKYTIGQPYAM